MTVAGKPLSAQADPIETAKSARPNRGSLALQDLGSGLSKHWLWRAMAMQDIVLRYRGSVLGPLWLTLSAAIMIAAMGLIYSQLFNIDPIRYVPFLAVGLLTWQFISSVITDGCEVFMSVQHAIQQVRLPYTVHVFRSVFRNLLILGHNAVLIPIAFLVMGHGIGWEALMAIPGLLLLCLNGIWISLLLGMVSARFRDIPPIVAALLQVVFFATPVFWPVENLGRFRHLGEMNPLFAAIDIVRAPLLGEPTAPHSWLIVGIMTTGGLVMTAGFFSRFRSRIAYWV
ncbi:ABC transporter permease [Nitrospirillum iridis]|uniref:ABC-2 type transport system permease protein/lipopolysaccharide transport system permease protein n=1 Tax=Nitrospirillum iridis TaxID=765888 RepID=A0A7X0EDI6_9PROT|nr:ABC transporter permease [Nitrospirillum iridis]MBB6252822.1 ABC-2 type transport system permease protein/lipopolysaccharide transport system permease protein [Nitrospirillum iridis]